MSRNIRFLTLFLGGALLALGITAQTSRVSADCIDNCQADYRWCVAGCSEGDWWCTNQCEDAYWYCLAYCSP